MIKPFIKLFCLGSFVMLTTASSCVPDPVPNPDKVTNELQKVSKEDVQNALTKAEFKANPITKEGKETLTSVSFYFEISASKPDLLKAGGESVKISKIDFFFDNELISTAYEEPYIVEGKRTDLSENKHKIYAQIYGYTSSENLTFITLSLEEYNLAEYIDFYWDYNMVGEGDTFTVTAEINPDKTAHGIQLKSFTAYWDKTPMGTCTSAPFTLTHKVTEPAGSKVNVKLVSTFSDGQSYILNHLVEVYDSGSTVFTNDILSRSNVFTQADILRCKAQTFYGKDSKWSLNFVVYFDDVEIGSSSTFPYTYEKSLRNVSKGKHILKWCTTYLDPQGNVKNSSYSQKEIIVE